MILNLFFIKNTNGLFYYALDYYKTLSLEVDFIIVNDSILLETIKNFEGALVKKVTLKQFIKICFKAFKEKIFIFTPSSHPIPFISRQLVVVHDPYPFYGGAIQIIKRLLLGISLISSRCYVGHVNISNALPFIKKYNISDERIIFIPNKFPDMTLARDKKNDDINSIGIGLVGTDSQKKRYEFLFKEALLRKKIQAYKFKLFGHSNKYVSDLLSEFDTLNIEVIDSDENSLEDFFKKIDIIVSVAVDEGFSRPIAAALKSGIPCYLLDTPVFREFYCGSAFIYDDIPTIIDSIICKGMDVATDNVVYIPPNNIMSAFESASLTIKNLIKF